MGETFPLELIFRELTRLRNRGMVLVRKGPDLCVSGSAQNRFGGVGTATVLEGLSFPGGHQAPADLFFHIRPLSCGQHLESSCSSRAGSCPGDVEWLSQHGNRRGTLVQRPGVWPLMGENELCPCFLSSLSPEGL